MATVILGNGSVTFGDSSSVSTNTLPYTNVSDRKTLLSQFTNDLGNYGSFYTSTQLPLTTANSGWPWPNIALKTSGTGDNAVISVIYNNCNCQCQCNC
jgi:hypothetical protein